MDKVIFGILSFLGLAILVHVFIYTLPYLGEPATTEGLHLIVITLIAFVFVTAFLALYGKGLIARLRKVGPVELISETLSTHLLVLPKPPRLRPTGRLTPEEKDVYQQIDDFLLIVKITGLQPEDMHGRLKANYQQALFYGGLYASLNKENLKAVRLLEHHKQEAGESPEVAISLAYAYAFAGDDVLDPARKQDYLSTSVKLFERALELSKAVWEPYDYYNLGWFYDELGQFEKAIKNYQICYTSLPQEFDAVYNIAASYSKWGKLNEALHWLEKIPTSSQIWKGIGTDPDFNALRREPEYGPRFARLLGEKVL